jgi:hypothetical protein
MASVTLLTDPSAGEAQEVWNQLKPVNREFVVKQISKHTWDFAVDISRFSLSNLQNTSANDLLIQQAMSEFGSSVLQVRDQILSALSSSSKEYGQVILEDLNRQLNLVHQRLEAITRENASMNPTIKESLASLNATASAVGSLLTSLKLPSVKGELGEINVIDNIRSGFLAIPSVNIEQFGGSGETDAIIHFDLDGLELVRVLIECKNRTAWSSSFLTQLEQDMLEQRAEFGILVTTVLPRDAKSRGFAISEKTGMIIITTAELAPAIALILYELVRTLDKLSNKAQTFQALLRSRELVECVTNNLSLIQPLQNIIKSIDKAHVEVTATVNRIIDEIRRNNAKLAENLPQHVAKACDSEVTAASNPPADDPS